MYGKFAESAICYADELANHRRARPRRLPKSRVYRYSRYRYDIIRTVRRANDNGDRARYRIRVTDRPKATAPFLNYSDRNGLLSVAA